MNKKKKTVKNGWDIMQVGNVINEKFPEFSDFKWVEIDVAMEDLFTAQKWIRRIASDLKHLQPGDYNSFSQLLCDLKFSIEHSKEHIEEAKPLLNKLWCAVSEKADSIKKIKGQKKQKELIESKN